MSIKIGDSLPNLAVTLTTNDDQNLADFAGKKLVLYFYPKDSTPGCTTQGQNFRDLYSEFEAQNCEIIGVSRESVRSHTNFITKQSFPFDLISDPDETLCNAFDVIKEKSMYGKTYMGIERSTFVFDSKGILRHEIRKVKVKGHVDEVLELVKHLD
jgi:peroxiredoxin Q/BCP